MKGVLHMNRFQLLGMWIGIGAVVTMCIFPPTGGGGYGVVVTVSARYIDTLRLAIQILAVVIVSLGVIVSNKTEREGVLYANRLYLWAMWVGILAVVTMCVIPPTHGGGYQLIGTVSDRHIDILRLTIQILAVALVGFGAIVSLRSKKPKEKQL